MDGGYSNGMNTLYQGGHQRHSYTELPNFQSQFQDPPQHGSHTLPPIQPQRSSTLGHVNSPYDQIPRRQQSAYSTNAVNFPVYTTHGSSQPIYTQSIPQYPNSTTFSQQSGHGMPLGHEYPPSANAHLANIRPMPIPGSAQMPGLPSSLNPSQGYGMQGGIATDHDLQPRTHVVGSQGRRGILPSDEGRPTAVAGQGVPPAKAPVIPVKDADGKFPCPHCNKNYLHAKHLKRHLLRHTGDRPYSCVLCNDTFSRSDILKRHFQKCSIRRGNPTGATHLSNSQSHLKKQGMKKTIPTTPAVDTNFLPMQQTDGLSYTQGNQGLGLAGVSTSSAPPSATISDLSKRFSDGGARDRRSMTGPSTSGSYGRSSFNIMSGQTVASPVPSSGENTPLTAKAPGQLSQSIQHDPQRMGSHHSSFASITNQNRNSLPQMPHTSQIDPNNFDWAAFQSNQRASVMGGQFNASEQTVSIKNEGQRSKSHFDSIPDGQHDDLISGLFETSRGGPVGGDSLNGWNLPDSYQAKADRLMILCQLDGPSDPDDALLRYVLTPDNIDHFVQSFTNCHVHWPTLHLPTFNPADANDGLLLAVICIGAVYSERVSISQVRTLMKRFKRAIEQSSQVLAYLEDSTNEAEISQPTDSAFYDELTALVIIDAQAIWHGENEHRQNVINEFGRYVTVARRLRLFEPAPPGSPNFSILHQPGSQEHISMEEWDWSSWIWQERQVRFVYVLFLSAVALVLYFNSPSVKLSSLEIKLPLPSDDATFEAPTPSECALALGFHGPTSQGFNVSGSGRKKQPELNSALRALQHPSYEFASKSTNAYSKFILVHAVHLQLFKAQKQLSSQAIDLSLTNDFSFCGVSHFDWITQGDRDLGGSANTSGHATPDGNTSPRVQQFLKTIHTSLDKWKRMWDDDLPLQYPPGTSRVGFCRDPIHFYWLARMILQKPLSADWQWPPMQKFASVMTMLKQVKNWVNNDSASRGEVSGSVGAIDESYGIGDLTHDMKLLFTPVSPEFSSPSATSNSGGLSVMEQHGSWPPNFSG